MLSNDPLSFPRIPCYTVGGAVGKHSGMQQAELKAGTLDETGFAQIYFAFYPYLGGNA